MKSKALLPTLLAALGGDFSFSKKKTSDKPAFSDSELKHLRALPKKEKKRAVRELQEKYFAERKKNG